MNCLSDLLPSATCWRGFCSCLRQRLDSSVLAHPLDELLVAAGGRFSGRGGRRRAASAAGLTAPLRVALVVEPTPLHVSGYANRFKETLRYLRAAGGGVGVITPDDKPRRQYRLPVEAIRDSLAAVQSLVISFFDYPRLAVFASHVLGLLGLIVRGKDGNTPAAPLLSACRAGCARG